MISPIKLKVNTKLEPMVNQSSLSRIEISFDNLFKILPKGILSKNSVKGAYIRLIIISLWINLLALRPVLERINALKNAKLPKESEK
jgi:hypothetical protein